MLTQIQIHPDPAASTKDKGDFFEDLVRVLMEAQRYKVTQRINFTGTEIDLLCEHLDRPNDSALVECKARTALVADDIKNFCFDVVVSKRAKFGFFVHTTELQHQAAGLANEVQCDYSGTLMFWGPTRIVDLLVHQKCISAPQNSVSPKGLTPTKQVLYYTYMGRYWVTLFSNQIVPTHYRIVDGLASDAKISSQVKKWFAELDELKTLTSLPSDDSTAFVKPNISFEIVAEIQEAEEWDDYRPVGTRYFVGREDIRNRLYQQIQIPLTNPNGRRVFFVEGKSGWGKSSLIAELRARSRNKRNKNTMWVFAVDSRGADTSDFVTYAFAKMAAFAARAGFIPQEFAELSLVSAFDLLASERVQKLLEWLAQQRRVVAIIFDQFEDVFRKDELFRAFHKLMVDVDAQRGNLVIGFSWKSEIYIPIDNKAYSLWQQARDLSDQFVLEEFLGYEVDGVLKQLQEMSGHQLPADLKRRLRDLQRFPWLIKKLSIHCFRQMRKGMTPESLVDQNLNVEDLFRSDTEGLSPEESRALNLIAKRGYDGEPFDAAEIDEKIQEPEINALLGKRLIVRSGGKYNVYWDNFRDYLIEGHPPTVAESFLLRQFPTPCISLLGFLFRNAPCTLPEILISTEFDAKLTEGTALNHLRELRYLGAIKKVGDKYQLRPSIHNLDEFKDYISKRLNSHVVVRALTKVSKDQLRMEDLRRALTDHFKGYQFSEKTWDTYAKYMIAWLRYAGIDFGRRLIDDGARRGGVADAFTPQRLPNRDIEVLNSFLRSRDGLERSRSNGKELYDLKSLGLITYQGKVAKLTKRGATLLSTPEMAFRKEVAKTALLMPKIAAAYEATLESNVGESRFEDARVIGLILEAITSPAYRKVTMNILKAWGAFVFGAIHPQ